MWLWGESHTQDPRERERESLSRAAGAARRRVACDCATRVDTRVCVWRAPRAVARAASPSPTWSDTAFSAAVAYQEHTLFQERRSDTASEHGRRYSPGTLLPRLRSLSPLADRTGTNGGVGPGKRPTGRIRDGCRRSAAARVGACSASKPHAIPASPRQRSQLHTRR